MWHNGSTIISAASGTIPVGQWTHFAFVRSGSGSNNFKLYINGVMTSQASSTATFFGSSGTFYIGQTIYDQPFNNTISNFRITKGGALYTSNFIPSTTPLTTTVASGTVSLLTCQSNRFVDNSASPVTLTPVTSPSVQAFSPFNPTAAYSTSTVGGSGYFDGTGDFLSVTNNAAFNFGSAAFTIEFWYYPTTLSGTQCLITNYGGSTTGFVIQMGGSTAGSGRIDAGFSGDGADITSTNAVQLNSWNHIAISGTPGATGIKLFINGAQEGSTYTGATSLDTSSTLLIGEVASTNRLSGYLSGLRLLKGTAQYTTTFTPPTAPLTNITNTSLLLNYTNGGIIDNTAKNNLETVGGASISTTVSKFGGSSMYFDGTGDALYIPDSPNLKFGTGDFTMEAWVYLTATPSAQFATIIGRAEYGSTGDWIFQVTNALKLTIYINTGYTATSTGAISLNTWTHVAAVRYGSSVRLFINGVQDGSGTSSASTENNATGVYTVGSDQAADEAMFTGYINDLRLTKGIARYTQNFTPPTTAFLTL